MSILLLRGEDFFSFGPINFVPAPTARLLLTTLLAQIPSLLPADAAAFATCWQELVSLRRGDFLVRPGQAEQRLCLVRTGLLRIYYPTPAGDEICVGFGHAGSLLCSFPSFVTGKPSEYAIQALRQTELLAISRPDFQRFMQQVPALADFWRAELEKALVGRMEHEIDLLLPEPAQRLARLRWRNPAVFQLVPGKYLASYLRMTPETLSRLS